MQNNNNVEISMVYKPKIGGDTPYGVMTCWDCDDADPTQGGSEMAWFKTQAEQLDYYMQQLKEHGGLDAEPALKYHQTGKQYIEQAQDNYDEPWALMYTISTTNLCDMQNDECKGNKFYTDADWAITHWCEKHFNNAVADGTFKEVTNGRA